MHAVNGLLEDDDDDEQPSTVATSATSRHDFKMNTPNVKATQNAPRLNPRSVARRIAHEARHDD